MLTEEEARKLWCPFSRVLIFARSGRHVDSSPAAYNRIATDDNGKEHTKATLEECCCIASQCMAWRWGEPASATRFHSAGGGGADEDGVSMTWKKKRRITADERRGYCGLAGREG